MDSYNNSPFQATTTNQAAQHPNPNNNTNEAFDNNEFTDDNSDVEIIQAGGAQGKSDPNGDDDDDDDDDNDDDDEMNNNNANNNNANNNANTPLIQRFTWTNLVEKNVRNGEIIISYPFLANKTNYKDAAFISLLCSYRPYKVIFGKKEQAWKQIRDKLGTKYTDDGQPAFGKIPCVRNLKRRFHDYMIFCKNHYQQDLILSGYNDDEQTKVLKRLYHLYHDYKKQPPSTKTKNANEKAVGGNNNINNATTPGSRRDIINMKNQQQQHGGKLDTGELEFSESSEDSDDDSENNNNVQSNKRKRMSRGGAPPPPSQELQKRSLDVVNESNSNKKNRLLLKQEYKKQSLQMKQELLEIKKLMIKEQIKMKKRITQEHFDLKREELKIRKLEAENTKRMIDMLTSSSTTAQSSSMTTTNGQPKT